MAKDTIFLSDEEREDMVVATYAGYERDRFAHELNLERQETILNKLSPEDLEKQRQSAFAKEEIIKKNPKAPNRPMYTPLEWLIINHRDTVNRILEHDEILEAATKQLPNGDRFDNAKKRYLDKKKVKE